jgi:glycosyltransferase involved in cell wall biosynthesis
VYCYWNDVEAYAAILAKRTGVLPHVVSRAHGFDVYVERRRASYQPFKRQLLGDFDAVFPASTDARQYLVAQHGADASTTSVRHLGVVPPSIPTGATPAGHLHVVSVANCVEVKQLHRTVAALGAVADAAPDLELRWTHIGDGPLRRRLEALAAQALAPRSRLEYAFLGSLANTAVLDFLSHEQIDVLLSTSRSEGGAPVSMMEAMVRGIPVIGPDVGGVPDILTSDTGWLLPADADVKVLRDALLESVARAKEPALRAAARKHALAEFDARENYPAFVEECWARVTGYSPDGGGAPQA